MYKVAVFIFSILLVFTACSHKRANSNIADYDKFMQKNFLAAKKNNANADLGFWVKRIENDSDNFVNKLKATSAHLKLFHLSGNVTHLHAADSLLKSASSELNNKDPEILFAISQNSISQHRFEDAIFYNSYAYKESGNPYIHTLLEFDTRMETGSYKYAGRVLDRLEDKNDFEFLIRKAKQEDHNGNLFGAIKLMEKAFLEVRAKSKSLYCWTLSNLADMYSHAGRIKEAYKSYLDVLEKDPSYLYALKGISWIVYSGDKKSAEAKRIINYILTQTSMPDLWLRLAEIEEWEGNIKEKNAYLEKFIAEVTRPEYENMYNKYLILNYCDDLKMPDKAISLALKEISNRGTPETYNWLAWAYFCKGEYQKAFAITLNYVYGKTFEPESLYRTAMIFLKSGRQKEAIQLLNKCMESSFELGPLKTSQIQDQLNVLKKL